MRRSVRRVVAAAATTVVASLGFTALPLSPASASAYAPCPASKVCLYDHADFTQPLLVTDENAIFELPKRYDNRISSAINNTETDLWLFTGINFGGPAASVLAGKQWVAPREYDNQISSLYLY
jgi:hypothetical protein